MSWYYMTVGLLLYALDNAVRLSNTIATEVVVKSIGLAVQDTDLSSSSTTSSSALLDSRLDATSTLRIGVHETGVTELSYTVMSKDRTTSHPLCHLMGQYVYVNIPAVSSLEWHPFTISSSPTDSTTTHHIKVMGGLNGGQWTAKLHKLAMTLQANKAVAAAVAVTVAGAAGQSGGEGQHRGRGIRSTGAGASANASTSAGEQGSVARTAAGRESAALYSDEEETKEQEEVISLSSITVNIDGPYGLSVTHELHKYTHVLLIGGGIGVTPLHSCLRHLLLMKMCASECHVEAGRDSQQHNADSLVPFPFPDMRSVELLWSVKNVEESFIFADTVSNISNIT
jgi:FAD-binding domain/Ferric reductase NAD binding domain